MADPSYLHLMDKVDELSRLVARQSATLGRLAEAGARPGPDVPLLVELHALRGTALDAAGETRSRRERDAFEAIACALERLLAGRGGALVAPRPGHPFSTATMTAAEEVPCAEPALDRTVAALLAPGLEVEGRSVRPARVTVHRYAPQAAEPPEKTPEPEAAPLRAAPDPTAGKAAAPKTRKAAARTRRPARPA